MKNIYLFLLLLVMMSSCQSGFDTESLDKMLRDQNVPKEQAIKTIEEAYKHIESLKLDISSKSDQRSGVAYDYTIFRSDGKPVKIIYDIKGDTYTVQASYYVRDSIPYYIHGTMRDQDRASGRYTHQELFTYLDGHKVVKQLRRTAVNAENRASDLSNIPKVDITKNIKQPDLDAIMKYEEVKNILQIQ